MIVERDAPARSVFGRFVPGASEFAIRSLRSASFVSPAQRRPEVLGDKGDAFRDRHGLGCARADRCDERLQFQQCKAVKLCNNVLIAIKRSVLGSRRGRPLEVDHQPRGRRLADDPWLPLE